MTGVARRERILQSINYLCVLSAWTGLFASLTIWYHEPPTMLGPYDVRHYPTVIWWIQDGGYVATLFLGGVVLGMFTPLGAILQSPLIVVSIVNMIESGDELPLDGIDQQIVPWPGFILGCISMTAMAASCAYPIGSGIFRPKRGRNLKLTKRLLAFSRFSQ